MLRVSPQLHYNTSTASSSSDLTPRTLFCSVFVIVVHTAGCDKYRYTDASPQVHGGLSQLLFRGPARQRSIAKPAIADDPDLYLSLLHSDYCQPWRLIWKKTPMVWLRDAEKNIALSCTVFQLFIIIIIKNECHSNIIVDRLQGCGHSKKLREGDSESRSSKVV